VAGSIRRGFHAALDVERKLPTLEQILAWIDWLDRKASRSHRSASAINSIRISETFSIFQSCHSAHE